MKYKRGYLVLLAILIAAVFVFFRWFHSGISSTNIERVSEPSTAPQNGGSPQVTPSWSPGVVIPDLPNVDIPPDDKKVLERIGTVFRTPINFWGRVVDQYGQSVAGAQVKYSFVQEYFREATIVDGGITDEQGLFSIAGKTGASVLVSVFKEGYYGTDESSRSFGYGMPSGEIPPTEEDPALFVLRRMGDTEPLIKLETGGLRVPPDGTPYMLSLRRARGELSAEVVSADVQIELLSDYKPPPPHGQRFDWSFRVSVPGGGIVERADGFSFEAPVENYSGSYEFVMHGTDARWKGSVERDYFLQLADGCYARLNLKVVAGGDTFIVVESYLNPVPGHRNLEYDSMNMIKPAVR